MNDLHMGKVAVQRVDAKDLLLHSYGVKRFTKWLSLMPRPYRSNRRFGGGYTVVYF